MGLFVWFKIQFLGSLPGALGITSVALWTAALNSGLLGVFLVLLIRTYIDMEIGIDIDIDMDLDIDVFLYVDSNIFVYIYRYG